ncbi:CGNR zinc finger domain-containing protein [Nocardioides sp.]|uniref:CGNR zinc finger domain-containing protein n=1 Tax=Nocardioides sp. TaxID=35761 RepID=UPI002638EBED|nr:CGNR zinc finger domain-containing protein [Nocardioides sp.]MDI6909699.1 CGNR zinc finger domain-containing protein [Nocardioides sp.]
MPFTHDTEVSLQAAVILANSGLDPDTLTRVADLDAFYAEFEYTGRHDRDRAELDAVRAIRPALYELLTADRDQAVGIVNEMLAEAAAVPRLVRHDVWDWHVHAVAPESDLPTRILVETAMAMIDVIRADEMSRLGVCADESCDGVVLDLSRNRSKRFCSTTCGNRNAVAAYRARQAEVTAGRGSGAAPR